MGWFFALLAGAIAVSTAIGFFASTETDNRDSSVMRGIGVAFISAMVLAGVLLTMSLHKVPVQNVGIVHSFGKKTGETTGAGLHLTAPWEGISDWDGSKQSRDYRKGNGCVLGDKKYAGVKVRIASLADACVEGLVEWETIDAQAPKQWESYKKDFERFDANRVEPAITKAFNAAFGSHDPLKNLNGEGNLNVPLDPFADTIKTELRTALRDDVTILTVIVTRVNYDARTQGFIEAYQQEILKGRTLEKAKVNADLQAQITAKNSVRDFRAWCLEIAEAKGGEPGFCLGGGNPVQNTRK